MEIDLFQPCRIGNLEFGNRFVRSATYGNSANRCYHDGITLECGLERRREKLVGRNPA